LSACGLKWKLEKAGGETVKITEYLEKILLWRKSITVEKFSWTFLREVEAYPMFS